jgi:hypothetical protein
MAAYVVLILLLQYLNRHDKARVHLTRRLLVGRNLTSYSSLHVVQGCNVLWAGMMPKQVVVVLVLSSESPFPFTKYLVLASSGQTKKQFEPPQPCHQTKQIYDSILAISTNLVESPSVTSTGILCTCYPELETRQAACDRLYKITKGVGRMAIHLVVSRVEDS